jgi:class 3 adenylate cyclase/tetratricopeptide (TPR) repeat protein
MTELTDWLKAIGLAHYAERFAQNGVDLSVLPDLTDQDLEKLGVLLGHRRKIRRALEDLGAKSFDSLRGAQGAGSREHAERRQLTIMFCDLVESTALATRLDPEQMQEVITSYHRRCDDVIKSFDGFVAHYLGDGVLAYFGYPKAHEDDAESAVRAGLVLVEAVTRLDVGEGVILRARIGIATGLVVVGELVGEGSRKERLAGATPNLAARLQALAEPGTVIIDGATRLLLGELFDLRSAGPMSLKGFDQPVQIWRVLGESVIDSRFEALRTTTTPFLGRNDELHLLLRLWRQAEKGEGCVALICGEPGIGKSRLVQTALDRLGQRRGALCFFCLPHHVDSAFSPVITHLERAAGFRREDAPEQRLKKLAAIVSDVTADSEDAVYTLAALLSIPTGDDQAHLALSPQQSKQRTFDALSRWIEGLARRPPLLLVVEDAQWCDPTSKELFDRIIHQACGLPMLVLITFRPDFASPWLGLPHVTLTTLSNLSRETSADMVAHVAGRKSLPKDIAEQIVERTDGVPLFIEELTKAVIEGGMLRDAGDRYEAVGPSPALAIPTTLNGSLLARLDRLAPVREVAQIAAALGRTFSHDLISATATMPKDLLDHALGQLVGAELVFQHGVPPRGEYTFKHALVQDAAYSTLLRSNRQQLHGRIATVLETKFSETAEAQPELLARHFLEAGMVAKAVGYLIKAGRQAIARGTMAEAVAQLSKGLDRLSVMPDRAAHREQELTLQMTLGQALLAVKGYGAPEPTQAFESARRICDEMGRPPQLGTVLIGQFTLRCARGELERAKRHAEEIRQLGDVQAGEVWRCFGLSASGIVSMLLGEFVEARAYFERFLSVWDPKLRAYESTPGHTFVTILSYLPRTLACLGLLDEARRRRDEAVAEAGRLTPFTIVFAICNAWYTDWAIEGANAATAPGAAIEEVSRISREHGFTIYEGFARFIEGWRLGVLGQEEGVPRLLEGIAVLNALGTRMNLPFFLVALAEVYGKLGRTEEGLDRIAEAFAVMESTRERWAESEAHRIRGTLLASLGNQVGAEKSYRQALAVAEPQKAISWSLRAALDLAKLWRAQGKTEDARSLLAPIFESFKEGFDTPFLVDAKSLLADLSASSR